MIVTTLETFVARVAGTDRSLRSRGPDKWIMRCPVHPDHHPSLLVDARRFGPNAGAVSFICLAGCAFRDIALAFEQTGLIDFEGPFKPGDTASNTRSAFAAPQRELDQMHLCAAKRVRGIIKYAQPAEPDHPYLVAKGIQPNGALNYKSVLLLPLIDFDETIWAAQFIQPDGRKANAKQTRRGHTCYRMAGRNDCIFVAEGFSTGATVREATGCTTYCAMGLSNVRWLTIELVRRFGPTSVVIAADNDAHHAKNPGLTVARQIASDLHVRMICPDAPSNRNTDWNDYQNDNGHAAVAEAIVHQLAQQVAR